MSIQDNRATSIWDNKFLPGKDKDIQLFVCKVDSPYVFDKTQMQRAMTH
jgi:hypothetical protein